MQDAAQKTYTVSGPKGDPVLGMWRAGRQDILYLLMQNSQQYGDIIPFRVLGRKIIQVNHPDLVRYVLMENHKNYIKSKTYLRLEPAIGKGLFTSHGDKWRRDRQAIQPMFKKEQVEGYYFDIINEVSEKYKQRWLALTSNGKATINISEAMADITMEIILKMLFGKDNLTEEVISSLHQSYNVTLQYLKKPRTIPSIDFREVLHMPSHNEFKKALKDIETTLKRLSEQYRKDDSTSKDKYNMLALLIEAQKEDPENFTEKDIRDQSVSMVFGGFETTSVLMQWLCFALDTRPDVLEKTRADISKNAPCTMEKDSSGLTIDQINRMDYLSAAINETMRLYPLIWAVSRQPVETDYLGGYKVELGDTVLVPQIAMHRHPRWWEDPNAFIPERFMAGNGEKIPEGLYFPFAHGPRKCIGYKLAEMEAKIIATKFLPLFKTSVLNTIGNGFDPGISLKPQYPIRIEMRQV